MSRAVRADRRGRARGLGSALALTTVLTTFLAGTAVAWDRFMAAPRSVPSGTATSLPESPWLDGGGIPPAARSATAPLEGEHPLTAVNPATHTAVDPGATPTDLTPAPPARSGAEQGGADPDAGSAGEGAERDAVPGTPPGGAPPPTRGTAPPSGGAAEGPADAAPAWVLPVVAETLTSTAGAVEVRRGPGRLPRSAELVPLQPGPAQPAEASGTLAPPVTLHSGALAGALSPLRSSLHLTEAGGEQRLEVVVSGVDGCATSYQVVLWRVEPSDGPLGTAPTWVAGLRSAGLAAGCTSRNVVVTSPVPADLVADGVALSVVPEAAALR